MKSTYTLKPFLPLLVGILFTIHCDTKMQTEVTTVINPKKIQLTGSFGDKSDLSWSPDGSKIAFSYNHGATDLMAYSLYGENFGLAARIKDDVIGTMIDEQRIALSPDATKAAYYSHLRKHIWIISLIDGSENLLTPDHRYGYRLCWSPEGNYLAFDTFEDIWVVPVNGGTPKKISPEWGISYSDPSFSPDGTELAVFCENYRTNTSSICIVTINDGRVRSLIADSTYAHSPVWSPDGSRIAFLSNRNDTTAIWLIPATGGTATKLTKNYRWVAFPAWSPDGSKIAFRTTFDRICVVSVPGGDLIQVFSGQQGFPLWLPDGNTLHLPKPVDFSIISTVSINTRQVRYLTSDHGGDKSPTWFPDNSSVVFSRGNNIGVVTSSGGDATLLTHDSTNARYNPEISPDGTLIAYDNGFDIFIMPVTGGQAVNITKNINETLTQPTWSPDGKKMTCCVPYGLKIFSYESNQLVETAFVPGSFSNPSWSVEHPVFGSHIAVESSRSIYVISLESLKPEPVISDGHSPCWSPDGTQLAYVHWEQIYISPIFEPIK